MPELYRPGPAAILPGEAPGGLVFQLYDRADQLIAMDRIQPPGWQPSKETLAAARAAKEVCLVVYDGDTGVRWTDDEFQHSGLWSGMRLK